MSRSNTKLAIHTYAQSQIIHKLMELADKREAFQDTRMHWQNWLFRYTTLARQEMDEISSNTMIMTGATVNG